MSTKPVTDCDRCGAVKKNANHWFVAGLDGGAFVVFPAGGVLAATRGDEIANHKDLCGEECVIKETQEYLTSTKVVPKHHRRASS